MDLSAFASGLEEGQLRQLASLLHGGRVWPGCSPAILGSYSAPAEWAAPLAELGARGWTAALLAHAVDAVIRERELGRAPSTTVVCTRPNAPVLETVDTSVVVRRLFQQAQREVLIAGFRVTERDMLEPLRRPAGRELDVRLFVDLDPAIDALGRKPSPPHPASTWPAAWWAQFREHVWPLYLDLPRTFFAPSTLKAGEDGEWRSMHVKSVVVDRRIWFVTSANFTRRGHHRNIELGALIEDAERAAEVLRCFDEWVAAGVFVPVVGAGT